MELKILTCPKPADKCVGEKHDTVGDFGRHHNVSREYKKGDCHQTERIDSAENLDYDQRKRIVQKPHEEKRRNANRKIYRKPENDQHNE